MDSTSKFVLNGKNDVKSALVKAIETWKTPFDIKPKGVFGTVAKIKTGDVALSSEQLDIEFQVPF